MKKHKKLVTAIAVLVCIVIICFFAFDTSLAVRHYTVTSDKLSAGVTLALVTDLHSCKYGDGCDELIAAIDAQSSDIVLLGGDIFDDAIPHDNAKAFVKVIAQKYRCYYVTGNHEYWGGEADAIVSFIEACGVTVLSGTYETVQINGQTLNVCGITDPEVINYTGASTDPNEVVLDVYGQLEAVGNACKNGAFTLLLAHRPELCETYAQYGFDLALCGHTHGGLWRIPLILNGLFAGHQGFFPKYAGGEYSIEDMTLIISRGLARETTRVPRIFNRPELVIVELLPQT